MAFSHTQSRFSRQTSTSSVALAYLSNNTAGNILFACVNYVDAAASFDSLTDTAGNTWVQLETELEPFTNWKFRLYWVASCLGGANTVTFTTTGGDGGSADSMELLITEYSGPESRALDDSNTSTDTMNNTDFTSATITTTANDDLIACFAPTPATRVMTDTAGYAARVNDDASTIQLIDLLSSSAGAQQVLNGVWAGSTADASFMIALKEVLAAGGWLGPRISGKNRGYL